MEGQESNQSQLSGGVTVNAAETGGHEGFLTAAAAADEDGGRASRVVVVTMEELAGIRKMAADLADTMVRCSLLGGSTAGGRARAPVLPMKQQIHAYVSQHSPALDPEFAATYGPALAARRARFLQGGKKRTHGGDVKSEERKGGMGLLDLLWTLRNAVEAGILFEGLDPVVDVLLPLAEFDPIFLRVLVPRPPLLWALHVRPHISRIMSMLLLRFPLDVTDDDNADQTEGFVLLELVKHMTREETEAFVAQCGLMMPSLDYNFESMGDCERNVALDVYKDTGMGDGERKLGLDVHDHTGRLPPAHVRNVLSYALQADVHRQYVAFRLLAKHANKKPGVKAALQRAVRSVTEETLVKVHRTFVEQGSDMYECYLDPLLHLLDVAERRCTKSFLRRLARRMQENKVWGGETYALKYFEGILRRSLNKEEYQEVRGMIVPEWDD